MHAFGKQEAHIAKLRSSLDAEGDASLQNALTLCVDSLKSIPPYGHREVRDLTAPCWRLLQAASNHLAYPLKFTGRMKLYIADTSFCSRH